MVKTAKTQAEAASAVAESSCPEARTLWLLRELPGLIYGNRPQPSARG